MRRTWLCSSEHAPLKVYSGTDNSGRSTVRWQLPDVGKVFYAACLMQAGPLKALDRANTITALIQKQPELFVKCNHRVLHAQVSVFPYSFFNPPLHCGVFYSASRSQCAAAVCHPWLSLPLNKRASMRGVTFFFSRVNQSRASEINNKSGAVAPSRMERVRIVEGGKKI